MIAERFGWKVMQRVADKQRQFMSVLDNSRNASRATPVVIKMRLLVRQHLHLVWLQAVGVVNNIVAGWSDSSLTNRLTDKIEIVPDKKTKMSLIA